MLKLLLDEMYAGLKEYFEILGWDVLTVQEAGLQGIQDRKIIEHAKKNNLILVTQDQKPANLAELTGVKYVLISNAMIARIADAKIREKYSDAPSANLPKD
ncbi:MAG: DUF5615 family PIN-like protein [Candidatus Bathyarchaeota archaeon]|nr:MAG: DUF5615 family PIN-like protein [Candidatus Bathyarchaeota archaeon]